MENYISELEKMYLLEIKSFYSPHFKDTKGVEEFIRRVWECDWNERRPRQMLFQVQRFVSLATEIDKICPSRDGLRALFFKCCMESLAKLSGMDSLEFYETFASSFSVDGTQHILNNFTLLFIECNERKGCHEIHNDLVMDDILTIIKTARDMVVHEGNYWELQLFANDNDSAWLTHIETNKNVLSKKTFINKSKKLFTYHFETTLQYEKFRFYFVEACITFINNYIIGLA